MCKKPWKKEMWNILPAFKGLSDGGREMGNHTLVKNQIN